MDVIRLYEPYEDRWLEVPMKFVNDHDNDANDEKMSALVVKDGEQLSVAEAPKLVKLTNKQGR